MTLLKLPSAGEFDRERFVVVLLGNRGTLGEQIEVSWNGRSLGNYLLRDRWVGDLGQLPASLLELAYDPVCRTFSGVCAFLNMTQEVEGSVQMNTLVTAMILMRDEEKRIEIVRGPQADRIIGGLG